MPCVQSYDVAEPGPEPGQCVAEGLCSTGGLPLLLVLQCEPRVSNSGMDVRMCSAQAFLRTSSQGFLGWAELDLGLHRGDPKEDHVREEELKHQSHGFRERMWEPACVHTCACVCLRVCARAHACAGMSLCVTVSSAGG